MSSLTVPLVTRLNAVINKSEGIVHEPNFRPLCPVKVNGIKVNSLIDSGNLVGVAISESFAKQLLGNNLAHQLTPVADSVYTCKRGKAGKVEVLGRVKKIYDVRLWARANI